MDSYDYSGGFRYFMNEWLPVRRSALHKDARPRQVHVAAAVGVNAKDKQVIRQFVGE
jgi:hypothetical protein